ncbi:MAG: hypothetical protein A2275_09955 [Bacteroidetes bacterium RIFOXYA12_FULL_35_11]|nr:MAG: hypothetical protein A2X01_09890 [Bacteroidetes bacterium GWF2_35_48]OFY83237.1 MAG: hypothetical protein A2275_09955 [Bacteroidetes bacterium RIFOXYA12_FULL_35_11]OFY94461.1 MAG: hypothetical protein A2309_08870 [Bacteroidetes bacterium RIFOXYB2_FULL_35_7]OFY97927.1 MAG: hypothetical protein A2491_18245 [Bacteroidetes bacterium RIFOXYC12_FULL_35_7]HBX51628.1 hypothetical protein [Bacteroidales bacterium]
MPTYGMLLLFNTGTYLSFLPFEYQKLLYIIVFLATFVLPVLMVPLFLYRNFIQSMEMHQRNERFFPMIGTLIFYSAAYILFTKLPLPDAVKSYMLAVAVCVALSLIITIKWKISTHMIGIGGIAGVLVALSIIYSSNQLGYLAIILLISGFIGFSRLQLQAHTPAQVYAGFFLGFFVELITIVSFT